MKAYQKATSLLTDTIGTDIPPEILNNIGSLHFKLGNYQEALVTKNRAGGNDVMTHSIFIVVF